MRKLVLIVILVICVLALVWPSSQPSHKAASEIASSQIDDPIKQDLEPNSDGPVAENDLVPIEEILKRQDSHDPVLSPNGAAQNSAASGVIVFDHSQGSGYSNGGNNGEIDGSRGSYHDPGADFLDALREVGQQYNANSGSGFYGGARVDNSVPTPIAIPVETVQPAPTPEPTLKPVTGQSRGYTMLYLMEPKARQTVELQITNMIASQVQSLYLGVLVDGTFNIDYEYLKSIIRRIAQAKRSLTLVLYFTNGSAIRDKSISHLETPFNTYTPADFRTAIQFDSAVRGQYSRLVQKALPTLQLNKRINTSNRNFAIVMLEDNLDDASYVSMRALTTTVIGNNATYIRNPCPGCVDGNTAGGNGDGVEVHNVGDVETLGFNDALTLDGQGYALPQEISSNELPFDEVNSIAVTAASRGIRYFGLWRAARQGRVLGQAAPVPSSRNYEVPSASDLEVEITLLRAGLTEVQ